MAGPRRSHHATDSKPYHRSAPSKHFRNGDDQEASRPSKRQKTQDRGRQRAETFDNYRPHNIHPSTIKPPPPTIGNDPPSHSRRDRKTNRSTRIHSIRNLLARDALPADVKLDKERELAALLFDQQKDKLKSESSKMITRYHKVRFFERKKAEKKVKQLTRQRDMLLSADRRGAVDGVEGDPAGEEDRVKAVKLRLKQLKKIDSQLREAKVDLNYAIYSPLNAKYISVFPAGPNAQLFMMPTKKQKLLNSEQRAELEALQDDAVGLTTLGDKTAKPPMWWEVEKIMFPHAIPQTEVEVTTGTTHIDIDDAASEEAIQKRLEQLREGKLTGNGHTAPLDKELVSGNTRGAVESRKGIPLGKTDKSGSKKQTADAPGPSAWGPKAGREAWMDEDGHIDPGELHSASDGDVAKGGVRPDARSSNGNASEASDSDSDNDGGFFER